MSSRHLSYLLIVYVFDVVWKWPTSGRGPPFSSRMFSHYVNVSQALFEVTYLLWMSSMSSGSFRLITLGTIFWTSCPCFISYFVSWAPIIIFWSTIIIAQYGSQCTSNNHSSLITISLWLVLSHCNPHRWFRSCGLQKYFIFGLYFGLLPGWVQKVP